MTHQTLIPRAPFAGLPIASAKRGVIAIDRDGLALASVLARRGRTAALNQRARERFGIELPRGPRRAGAGGVAFAGTGPESWLVTSELGGNAFAASLQEVFGGLASVSDQSDGYAVLRLTGPKLRDTLAKIIPIDLHPRAFKPGDVASTLASHVGATLWRLEDDGEGWPGFELAVFRSFAGSFWHALSASAAEFGLVLDGPHGESPPASQGQNRR